MARPGVTREMIFEAADAIAREGRTPTVLAIRERLGGGSPNTISPHLVAWKEQNEAKPAESLPPLPDSVQSAMRQV
ncbi:MAG: DNA-binding protein, partial [Gammaproteobacteria bacterium]|nr:DNA-binding protein [Gammaproteobacteria bacterium]